MRTSRLIRVGGLLALLSTLALANVHRPLPSSSASKNTSPPIEDAASPTQIQSRRENFTYYTLRPDLRRCASPMCGGFFVKRVNHARTICADGRRLTECYVAEIDWNGQPSGEARMMLVRASLIHRPFSRSRRFGVLRVLESWRAATERPPIGTVSRVRDLGIRCITHPCLTHEEERLNSNYQRKVAGVELNGAHASPDSVAAAHQRMTAPEGVIVAATPAIVTGPAGRAQTLRATQFYLLGAAPVSQKPCIKTGCGGQVCSDEEVITTCEWRPEHDCYRRATCERQANGECGFTPSRELTACLRRR
ncbi:MAG TPA: DUF6748 domain-containing protein [Pyrinomonadaceae bacterium]